MSLRNLNNEELLQAYFEGVLTNSEEKKLMHLLDEDPLLRHEFDLQQDINQGLQEFRRNELKARLDSIPVNYTTGILGTFSAFQLGTSAAVFTSVLTVGAWLYFYEPAPDFVVEPIEVSQQEQLYVSLVPLSEKPTPLFPEVDLESSELKESPKAKILPKKQSNLARAAAEQPSPEKSKESPRKAEISAKTMIVQLPEIDDFEPGKVQDLNREEQGNIPNNPDQAAIPEGPSKFEIETLDHNRYNFHYKFNNSKLFLYGDFDNSPYELLEINAKKGKSLFLYFQGNFYSIQPGSDQVKALKKIDNEDLIQELTIIREKKQ